MPGFVNGIQYKLPNDQYDLPADSLAHAQTDAQQAMDAAAAAVASVTGLDPIMVGELQDTLNQFDASLDATDTAMANRASDDTSLFRGALTRSGARPVGQGETFVNVMDHGAVGDAAADDTAAIQAAINDATNRGVGLRLPENRVFRCTSGLFVNTDKFKLIGDNESALFFSGTGGLSVVQNNKYDSFDVDGVSFVTDSIATSTGLSYTNTMNTTGDARVKTISRCLFFNAQRFDSTLSANGDNGDWKTAIELNNYDRGRVVDTQIFGSETNRNATPPGFQYGFPRETTGIHAHDSTMLMIHRTHIGSTKYGVWVSGQSESAMIQSSALVACHTPARFTGEAGDAPSNGHYVTDCHLAANFSGIDLYVDAPFESTAHVITGNFFLKRGGARGLPMRFIRLGKMRGTNISENMFMNALADDPAWDEGYAVEGVGSPQWTVIRDNYLRRVGVIYGSTQSGVVRIIDNTIDDGGWPTSATPIAGTVTPFMRGNMGHRLVSMLPVVSASPSTQEVVDALAKLGLVFQSGA